MFTKDLKLKLSLFLALVGLVVFQNCGLSQFGTKQENELQSGNGEGYDYKIKNYYHFDESFDCDGQEHPKAKITLEENKKTLTLYDDEDCEPTQYPVEEASLVSSRLNDKALGYLGNLFEKLDLEENYWKIHPDVDVSSLQVWCYDYSGRQDFLDSFVLKTKQEGQYTSKVYLQSLLGALNFLDLSYSDNASSYSYKNSENFELLISRPVEGDKFSDPLSGQIEFGQEAGAQTREVSCYHADRSSFEAILIDQVHDAQNVFMDDSVTCIDREDQTTSCFGQHRVLTEEFYSRLALADQVEIDETQGCYLKSGEVFCAGFNQYGAMGFGELSTQYDRPQKVLLPRTAKKIRVAKKHSCALLDNDDLYCWGTNSHGQLGNNYSPTQTYAVFPEPVKVGQEYGAKDLVLTDQSSCLLTTNKNLKCWGIHWKNVNSDIVTKPYYDGELVELGYPVLEVSSIGEEICARSVNDNIFCWGEKYGESKELYRQVLVQFESIQKISGGYSQFCALSKANEVACFGQKVFPAHKSDQGVLAPQSIELVGEVEDIFTSKNSACFLMKSGQVYCVGDRLGQKNALALTSIEVQASGGISQFVGGPAGWKALNLNRQAVSLQIDSNEQFSFSPEVISGEVLKQRGRPHTDYQCDLLPTGEVVCSGVNQFDRISRGYQAIGFIDSHIINTEEKFKQIAMSGYHGCGINDQDVVHCWGQSRYSDSGVLGRDSALRDPHADEPFYETILASTFKGKAKDIAVVHENFATVDSNQQVGSTCVIDFDNQVYCWGLRDFNRIFTAERIDVSGKPLSIQSGRNHFCVLTEEDGIQCWRNELFPYETSYGPIDNTPRVVVQADQDPTQFSMAWDHLCYVNKSAQVYCLGGNQQGQLGSGDFVSRMEPEQVTASLSLFDEVQANDSSTCGRRQSDGGIECWGNLQLTKKASWQAEPLYNLE